MRIVLLTRTSRPSGANIARAIIESGKDLVGIVAERRRSLILGKDGSLFGVVVKTIKSQGFAFVFSKVWETVNIKINFILRKIFIKKIFHNKNFSSVEELLLDYKKVSYFLVDNHNSLSCQRILEGLRPDVIVLSNTRLIKENIISIPPQGCINLHSSKLPQYAGLASVFWALYNGEREVGVTVHFVDENLDSGDIILQRTFAVSLKDKEKNINRRLLNLGKALIVEALEGIQNNRIKGIPQNRHHLSYYSWPTYKHRKLLKIRRKVFIDGKPKVLHIITRLVKGGAQENTLLTVLGLRERNYEVTLMSGPSVGREGEIESNAREKKVNLVIIPELIREMNLWKDLVSLWKIYRFIKKERFSIVHTHTSKAGFIGRLAAKLAGVPIIIHTPHGHIFHSYFSSIRTRIFLILEKISALFCDKIIALTDNCKREHLEFRIARKAKFVTIHSGIDVNKFLDYKANIEQTKKNLNIPLNSPVVGTVARLASVKGVNFLIKAVPRILSLFPDTYFLIVGDGKERKNLENLADELGCRRQILFTGLREDIPGLISVMDIFVLPSLNEGMGRVLIEAGLLSKPTVATRVSGIPELVKDNETGILVEQRSPQALAGGVIELLRYPERAAEMGRVAREFVLSGYSSEAMVDRIDELYNCLILEKLN